MYSRFSPYNGDNEKPPEIPQHYSGCAFASKKRERELPRTQQKPPVPAYFEVGKPSPPTPLSQPIPTQTVEEEVLATDTQDPANEQPIAEKPLQGPLSPTKLFGGAGSAFPFAHGLGFEELLILGLILLLSKNEGDSDMIMLLGLLLFCG